MNYFTDVYIGIESSCVESFKTQLEDGDVGGETVRNEFTIFTWKNVKWYENCKIVQRVMSAYQSIPNDKKSYLRIGEDWQDVEIDTDAADISKFDLFIKIVVTMEN